MFSPAVMVTLCVASAIVSVMVIVLLVSVGVITFVSPAALAVRLMPGSIPRTSTRLSSMLKNLFVFIYTPLCRLLHFKCQFYLRSVERGVIF